MITELLIQGATALAPILYAGFEYWLGKTKVVKANSTLEIALNVASAIVKAVKSKSAEAPSSGDKK